MSRVRHWVWVAGMLGSAMGLVAASTSSADDLRRVRVRIVADQPEVRISDSRGHTVRVVATSDGLTVDGKTAGARFEARDLGPYRVKARQGPALHVRGDLRVETSAKGLLVINEVEVEDYVAGTIGAEMYSFWEAAALRAQAVACRSYVLYQMEEMEDRPYDVTGDVLSQRYLGVRGESDSAWAALRATTGEIISYDGRPALAAFHSASGGQTASSLEVWGTSLPYLRSLPVADEDDSPDTYWRVTISDAHIEGGLAQLGHEIGSLVEVAVLQRTGSGRAGKLRFRGDRGRATVTGREIRQVLGSTMVKSTLFDMRGEHGHVVFVGSGNGHGVGMSQWAAQAMAQNGASYRDILENFYPGTSMGTVTEFKQRFAKRPTSRSMTAKPSRAGRRPGRSANQTMDKGSK